MNNCSSVQQRETKLTAKFSQDTCQVIEVHKENVNWIREQLPEQRTLLNLADLFKVLGDLTRVRILHVLSFEELCVCDLSAILDTTPSAVSHQLRTLRNAKLVKFRREGKMAYYSLDDEHVQRIFEQALEHIQE